MTRPGEGGGAHRTGRLRPLLPVFFVATGAAALVYEIVWFKLLGTLFGVTALATSTVLAVFMGGLGLGAALAARLGDRWERPLLVYGLLETMLALLAGLVPVALPLVNRGFALVYDSLEPSLWVLSVLRALGSAIVLLPPATLMGMTLPVLARAFSRDDEGLAPDVGFLYTINTLGAALGAAAAGFFLLPALGLLGTTAVAVAINLLVGVPATLLGLGQRAPAPPAAPADAKADATAASRPDPLPRALLAVSALSGFTSLGYQVFWTRALLLSLGNTVYAFSVILVTVLVGITVGGGIATFLLARIRRPVLALALTQAAAALAVVVLAGTFDDLPARFLELSARWGGTWTGFLAVTFSVAGLAMLPATVLLGTGLPLVLGVGVSGKRRLAHDVGELYSVNTWGAIAGSLAAGFLLLPVIGIRDGMLAVAFLNGLAAVIALFLAPGYRVARTVTGIAFLALLAAAAGSGPGWDRGALTSGVFVSGIVDSRRASDPSERLVYYREGVSATVSVKQRGGDLKLQVNGRTEATSSGDRKTNTMLGSLPLVLHPDPKEVAIIGLGSGITLGAALGHPVEKVDCVELSRGVVEAAALFAPFHDNALEDPRVRLLAEDGRNHLLLTRRTYDVIVSQPSNMWAAGVGNLFTREFFELCDGRLADDGLLCQWIQGYSISESSLRSVLRTVSEVFPQVEVWVAEWSDILVVASKRTGPLRMGRIEACFADAEIGGDLRAAGVPDGWTFLSHYMLDTDTVHLFSKGAALHTDDNRLVEMSEPRSLAEGTAAQQARTLLAWQTNVRGRLDEFPPAGETLAGSDESLGRAVAARRLEIEARALEAAGHGGDAVDRYREALVANPNDVAIRRNLAAHHVRMGVQLARSGDYQAAWANFNEAVRTDPTSASGWGNLGLVERLLGRADASLEASRRATELDPRNETYWAQLGDGLRAQRRFEEAADAYGRAVGLRPDWVPALLGLADALAATGEAAEAGEILERAAGLGAAESDVTAIRRRLEG